MKAYTETAVNTIIRSPSSSLSGSLLKENFRACGHISRDTGLRDELNINSVPMDDGAKRHSAQAGNSFSNRTDKQPPTKSS